MELYVVLKLNYILNTHSSKQKVTNKNQSNQTNQVHFYNIFKVTCRVTIVLVLLANFILSYYNTKIKLYNCTIHGITMDMH
jgi:Na+/H+ antiporter NhaD/arsenite permease-like protein